MTSAAVVAAIMMAMLSRAPALAANVTYGFDAPPANLAPLDNAVLQQAALDADLKAARAAWAAKDGPAAVAHYRQAIASGNVIAMVELADLEDHDNVGLIRIDLQDADDLYHRAALQGYAWAEYRIGQLYETGDGIAASQASAFIWYRLAAEQGLDPADVKMAVAFFYGDGERQDNAAALHYAALGEQAGGGNARYLLALFYLHGIGVPEDDARAFHLAFLAAEQGDPFAQYLLARMYAHGQGIQTDYDQAQHWEDRAEHAPWPKDEVEVPLY